MWSDKAEEPVETPVPRWLAFLVAAGVLAYYTVTEPRAAWRTARDVYREFRADGD